MIFKILLSTSTQTPNSDKNGQTSCPLQTFVCNISRHLEFITEQGHRVNWVSGSLDSRVTGSLGHKMRPSSMSGTRRRVEDRCRARSETSHGVVASGRRVETNAASTDLCRTQLASSLVVCLSGPTQRRQFFRAAAAAAESKHHRAASISTEHDGPSHQHSH